jgi:hypothetical protein
MGFNFNGIVVLASGLLGILTEGLSLVCLLGVTNMGIVGARGVLLVLALLMSGFRVGNAFCRVMLPMVVFKGVLVGVGLAGKGINSVVVLAKLFGSCKNSSVNKAVKKGFCMALT